LAITCVGQKLFKRQPICNQLNVRLIMGLNLGKTVRDERSTELLWI